MLRFAGKMARTNLNVQTFPRPPALEKISRHVQIKYGEELIVDTKDAYWVLETHHPPKAYYLPPASVRVPLTKTGRSSWCEWKGRASYYSISVGGQTIKDRIWAYESPVDSFAPIRDYLCFYAGPWDCIVDGERVEPQPGDFYGGWVTSDVRGIVKGKNGNYDPAI